MIRMTNDHAVILSRLSSFLHISVEHLVIWQRYHVTSFFVEDQTVTFFRLQQGTYLHSVFQDYAVTSLSQDLTQDSLFHFQTFSDKEFRIQRLRFRLADRRQLSWVADEDYFATERHACESQKIVHQIISTELKQFLFRRHRAKHGGLIDNYHTLFHITFYRETQFKFRLSNILHHFHLHCRLGIYSLMYGSSVITSLVFQHAGSSSRRSHQSHISRLRYEIGDLFNHSGLTGTGITAENEHRGVAVHKIFNAV